MSLVKKFYASEAQLRLAEWARDRLRRDLDAQVDKEAAWSVEHARYQALCAGATAPSASSDRKSEAAAAAQNTEDPRGADEAAADRKAIQLLEEGLRDREETFERFEVDMYNHLPSSLQLLNSIIGDGLSVPLTLFQSISDVVVCWILTTAATPELGSDLQTLVFL